MPVGPKCCVPGINGKLEVGIEEGMGVRKVSMLEFAADSEDACNCAERIVCA